MASTQTNWFCQGETNEAPGQQWLSLDICFHSTARTTVSTALALRMGRYERQKRCEKHVGVTIKLLLYILSVSFYQHFNMRRWKLYQVSVFLKQFVRIIAEKISVVVPRGSIKTRQTSSVIFDTSLLDKLLSSILFWKLFVYSFICHQAELCSFNRLEVMFH